jgi:hypothetical protein
MKALTCTATRRRLDEFLDGELPVADQIAVSAHLEWCSDCAAMSAELRSMGHALRAFAPGRTLLSNDEVAGFSTGVVSRLNAERDASMAVRVRLLFDDMQAVYAGLGATVAAAVCLVLMMGMMRFATDHRPDSLAAILTVMATPFECESTSEVPDAVACRARWVERFQRANESAEQDAVFTLDAVVIDGGRLANLAVLRANRRADATGQAEAIEELLDAVSRARSTADPTELSGNIVRFVARETVRTVRQPAIDLPLPPAKPTAMRKARARQVTA